MDNKTRVPHNHKKHNKFLMGLAMNLFVIDGNCQIQGKVNGKGFEELNWKLHARRRAEQELVARYAKEVDPILDTNK